MTFLEEPDNDGLFIRCAICGEQITRDGLVMLDDEWIHVHDVVHVTAERISTTSYDHDATPDIIEVQDDRRAIQQAIRHADPET